MRRVCLNANGLFITKPGYDVLSASNSQFSLNSGWKMFSPLLQGSVNLSAFNIQKQTSGDETLRGGSYVVNFGTTLSAPPVCIVTLQDPMQTDGTCINTLPWANSNQTTYYGGESFSYSTGGSATASFVVTTSSLTIKYSWEDVSYSPPDPQVFNYTIMRSS